MTCDTDSDFDEATVTSDLEAGYFNKVVFKMTMQSSLTTIEIADYFFISELMQSYQIGHEFDYADYPIYTNASNAEIDAYANLDRTLFIPVE